MEGFTPEILAAAHAFGIPGAPASFEVIKTGNINATYLCGFDDGGRLTRYIVQRINGYVFKNPADIMDNIAAITAHLQKKYAARGVDCSRLVLNFLHTADGRAYIVAPDGAFWRAYPYVENTVTYDSVPNPGLLTSAGEAFGEFLNLLSDFDMTRLHDTIPDFHNTEKRFAAFEASLKADAAGRAAGIAPEAAYLLEHRDFCRKLVTAQNEGRLPTRVTHNDTKYNNVLIDVDTHEPQAIIDLDTVMPGLAAYDFGDAIRFAANTSLEDEPDTTKTSLSLDYYEAFTKGYVGAVRGCFDREELLSLPLGALMMTLELVLRFCTDWLDGDKYFKINYPEHNLVRTRCQLALAQDMERKYGDMVRIVEKYL